MAALPQLVGLPEATRALLERFHGAPLAEVVEMRQEIRRHVEAVWAAHARNPALDVPLAEAIAHRSLQLLTKIDPGMPEGARRLIQAAVRYFTASHDVEADFTALHGFREDAQVLNAVLRALGQRDLVAIQG